MIVVGVGSLMVADVRTSREGMTPEEFLEWLEDFEPSRNDDKSELHEYGTEAI